MAPSMLFKFFVKHNYHDRYIREHNCVYEPQIVAYIFYGCKLERNYYDEYSNISYTWYIPKKVVTVFERFSEKAYKWYRHHQQTEI